MDMIVTECQMMGGLFTENRGFFTVGPADNDSASAKIPQRAGVHTQIRTASGNQDPVPGGIFHSTVPDSTVLCSGKGKDPRQLGSSLCCLT